MYFSLSNGITSLKGFTILSSKDSIFKQKLRVFETKFLMIYNCFRCGSKQSCSVPVNSSIFGDPCPGTSKYVEVHYTCIHVPVSTSTVKPRPPWLLDLSATPSSDWKLKTSPVTTTTTATTSASTVTTSSTTIRPSTTSTVWPPVTNAPVVTSTLTEKTTQQSTQTSSDKLTQFVTPLESDHFVNHCHPTHARGLFWNWTSADETAIQPCPLGTQGFARWHCSPDSVWTYESPDLSECQAHLITRMDTRLRNGESVIKVATDLMSVLETRSLYGGDIMVISQLMQTLAHRLRQDLTEVNDYQQRESLVTELMENVQRTASSLLDDYQEEAWNDLRPAERAAAGTALILGIEENAFLVADIVSNEKNLVDVTNNILSSIRVMQSRDALVQHFPSLDTLRMSDDAHLIVPSQSVREHAVNGAVRMIFFLYDKMDRVLPSSTNGVKFLNSKVVSMAVSKGRHIQVTEPITLTFKHIQTQGVSQPSCMWWDFVTRTWSDDNCRVLHTNQTHTSCHCTQLGNLAVLMEEGLYRDDGLVAVQQDEVQPDMATVVGIVVAVIAGMCFAVVGFFILRRLNLKTGIHKFITTGRLPCLQCRETKSAGLYPTINSSPTSTTLSSGTPTTSTTMSSNYFLNSECQIAEQQPVILSPVGNQSTIYRATLANGQQVPVIPVSHIQIQNSNQDPRNQFFRPVSPLGHIYMEIDPVYARLDPSDSHHTYTTDAPQSDMQLSDVSDDDLRRCSDISRQSSNRYAEERPLIRNTLRKSAPSNQRQAVRTVSAGCGSSLRVNTKTRSPMMTHGQHGQQNFRGLDTPITIALSPGGEQFVSLNLDQQQQLYQQQQQQQQLPPQRGYYQHGLQSLQ